MGIAAIALAALACSGPDKRLQQHAEKFRSLASTAKAAGEAWLAGRVSRTYTRITLQETFRLLEQERATLSGSPPDLVDPRGARLSQAAEKFARLLAAMIEDVQKGDDASLRGHLAQLPLRAPEGP